MDDRERLIELVRSMQRDSMPSLLRVQEDDDLSIVHIALLQVLDRDRGLLDEHTDPTVKELAALIGRSESRTSRLVDRMVRRGLVERYEDDADRRARRVRLSEGGAAALHRISVARVEAQMALWGHMTRDEQRTVIRCMEVFAEAARRLRDERDRSDRDRREHDLAGRRQGHRARRDDRAG
ncbi:DNA-binding MarR family transcriptional regulator [Nocardiopsis mwathae]|uniref:DNA-binding MarR family transcriptional regulator n=1 Tax=Nocardiopsis mwathae TaxID=1472723 RepID=A0A7W9YFP2_9ACTN|nr:MarR family transcriptional regulator [Nocardiopsis mwathae]MBB6170626.1 DNA-binding MarR family transcriptional regulator [Nocardiopsis mwathae]